jgi:hypothetical protein
MEPKMSEISLRQPDLASNGMYGRGFESSENGEGRIEVLPSHLGQGIEAFYKDRWLLPVRIQVIDSEIMPTIIEADEIAAQVVRVAEANTSRVELF